MGLALFSGKKAVLGAVAVAAVLGAVFILRPLGGGDAPLPPSYYESRPPLAHIPAHRDMLLDGETAPEETVAATIDLSPAATINEYGLMIGRLAGTLTISAEGMTPGGRFPLAHTCYRSNHSPGLSWANAPRNTRSYVVLIEKMNEGGPHDLHWSLYNIAASVTSIPPHIPIGAKIEGIGSQGLNHMGDSGYTGPCLSRGLHKFQIRIFALDRVLDLNGGASRADLVRAMSGHIIDMAVLPLEHYYRV